METPSAENLEAARQLGEALDPYLATVEPIKVQRLGGETLSGQRSGDSPGSSEIYLVTLPEGTQAFFKPLDGVDHWTASAFDATPESAAIGEVTAVAIARQLGAPYSDLVTSTVLREINGQTGTLCLRLEGDRCQPVSVPGGQLLQGALLDFLIGNQDRHTGNYLFDAVTRRLGLFDHGFSFVVPGSFVNASVLLSARTALGGTTLAPAERDAIERLDLDQVAEALTADRLDALRERWLHMHATGTLYMLDGNAESSSDRSFYSSSYEGSS